MQAAVPQELLNCWERQQQTLATQVIQEDPEGWGSEGGLPTLVGGVDISPFPLVSRRSNSQQQGPRSGPLAGGLCEQQTSAGLHSHTVQSEEHTCAKGSACPPAAAQHALTTPRPQPHDDQQVPPPERAVAGLVVLRLPGLETVYSDLQEVELTVPYLPGFLGFREVPAYLALLERARASGALPQVLMVDGYGLLHARRCGAASQLGLAAGVSTIGVAKNVLAVEGLERHAVRQAALTLAQQQQGQQPEQSGSQAAARGSAASTKTASRQLGHATSSAGLSASSRDTDRTMAGSSHAVPPWLALRSRAGEVLGAALLPHGTTRPIYVSVGQRLSLRSAVDLTLRCCLHRIPEPLRQADILTRVHARQLAARQL